MEVFQKNLNELIMIKELSIYVIILICVIFLQIDSFFLDGRFIGRELTGKSYLFWSLVLVITIIRMIKFVSDNINQKK